MKAILHQVQGIFIRHFLAKELINQGIKSTDKEEMMLALFCHLLERVFQGSLQKRNGHRGRHVEHLAASGDLAIVTIIRELSIHELFAVIDTADIFANRVLHVLGQQSLEPEFAGLVRQVAAEGHSLVAREKRRIALRANTQVQMLELDLCHL